MPPASRPRRLFALATDNRVARVYLAAVAASALIMLLFPDNAFAPSPLLLTAPLSFLTVVLPFGPGTEGGGLAEAAAIGFWLVWLVLCAFVNAAVLGALAERGPRQEQEQDTDSDTAAPDPVRPRPQRVRALLAPAVDNWLARGYLAVVMAALGFFLAAAYVLPDPGFAGIWPLMATAPLSIAALLVATPAEYSSLGWLNPLLFSAGSALSGLFNAVLLGRFARRLRTGDPRPAA
ncbi:hypothetical protein OK074_4240 [Actinobacteria bacterium OK074]|nr:hypothetical protein OK074_4240 [Actinobacteria bacterium OK074]